MLVRYHTLCPPCTCDISTGALRPVVDTHLREYSKCAPRPAIESSGIATDTRRSVPLLKPLWLLTAVSESRRRIGSIVSMHTRGGAVLQ